MKPNTISLTRGSSVMHSGQVWIVEAPEGFKRVLARREEDGHRDFLNISELSKVPRPEPPTVDKEDEDAEKPKLTYRERLLVPRIPVLPDDDNKWTKEQRRAMKEAVAEFELLVDALDAPEDQVGQMMKDIAEKQGYSLATAYRRRTLVEIWECADALLRKTREDAGELRLTDTQIEKVQNLLKVHRFVATPKTIPKLLDLVNGDLRQAGEAEISRTTLYKVMNLKSRKEQLEAAGRKEQAKNSYRTKAGKLPDADYPLAVVQADHSPIQMTLVDEVDRKPIGDAWLTIVIDCFSRMILGFYLSFGAPSTLNTGMALARAFLPKDDFLKRQGVVGEWNCWGFPDVLLVDNGADLNGKMVHRARRFYKFTVRNRPVGSPEFGAAVESAFRTFMYESKSTSGTKRSNPIDRAEYDSEGHATMTLSAYERNLTHFIVNEYHKTEHTGDGMKRRAPLQRWTQGIFDGDIFPATGLPPVPADPFKLYISLMPLEERTLTKGCISIFTHTYYSNELDKLSELVDVEKPLKDRQFEIRYDPRNIHTIWVKNPETGEYIAATAQNVSWTVRSLWEQRAINKNLGHPADEYKDDRYESIKQRDEIKAEEAKKTKQKRREDDKAKRDEAEAIYKAPKPPKKHVIKQQTGAVVLDPGRLQAIRSGLQVKKPTE
jgi:putative transposase